MTSGSSSVPDSVLIRLERLAAAGVSLLPVSLLSHFVFERGGFVALVERTVDGFGAIGAPGLLIESGYAALIWRGEEPWFIAQGFERRATTDEVDAARRFAKDVESALRP